MPELCIVCQTIIYCKSKITSTVFEKSITLLMTDATTVDRYRATTYLEKNISLMHYNKILYNAI